MPSPVDSEDAVTDVEFSAALRAYEEVQAKGQTPSLGLFKDLMQSYWLSEAASPEGGDEVQERSVALYRLYLLFREMKVRGVAPDAAVYNTLINACASAGDVEKAFEAMAAMQAEGIAPNVITYTSLIKACGINGGEGAVALAEDVFSAMQQRTNHFSTYVEPTELTFQRLIQAHLRAGATKEDTVRVWELWRDLISRGLKPGIAVCRSCVRAAKLDQDVDR
jgi:pentatricopeptide repeat protein